jgi:ABC-type nitrate/sulfonate/bicarbonate transport system permease component
MTSSFKINKISNLKHVIFFSAIPSIYSWFMIMIWRCIIGLVIADMFWYGVWLGYLLNFFNSTSDATWLFAMLIILLLINYLITAIFAIWKTLFIRRYHYEFE